MKFVKESVFQVTVEELFAFHERPDAFELLQPPWERSRVIQPPSSLAVGTEVILETKVGPLWTRIVAEHVAYEKNVRFEDIMTKGPFAKWHHQHLFFEHPEGARLRDEIACEAPLGVLGKWFGEPIIVRRLHKLFDYRHDVTRRELAT